MHHTTRRTFLSGAAALAVLPTSALAYPAGIAFAAIRNGKRIGEHRLSFEGSADDLTVRVRAEMAVKIGPVTVFRYAHDVTERWRGGRFERLESKTSSNGARESVVAQRSAGGVMIRTGAKQALAPANTLPFTHWNPQVANAPLFNPQTGKLLKVSAVSLGADRATRANGPRRSARSRLAFATRSSLGSSITLRATTSNLSSIPGSVPGALFS